MTWCVQVDVPSFSGTFGILPNHVPTLAVLKPGVVTVFEEDGSAKKFFVSSGSVSINQDASVQILAEEVHKVEDLDAAAARDIVSKAQSKMASASDEVNNEEHNNVHHLLTTFIRPPRQRLRLNWRLGRLSSLPVLKCSQ